MKNIDLTQGNIFSKLTRLALPIMATSFIQMAYNLTDIMWLGRLSTEAVAAAGAAGFFLWLGAGIILLSQIGVGVGVAQSYGKNDYREAASYAGNGIQLNIFLAIAYAVFLLLFRNQLIGFFNIDNIRVHDMAIQYLVIISLGMVFNFLNPVLSAILTSSGNSVTPFKINAIGLVFNMVLDPLFIFGLGPIKGYGIKGAALATVLSQLIVSLFFLVLSRRKESILSGKGIFKERNYIIMTHILKLGFPAFLKTSAHALISMVLTRMIAGFGPAALAAQSVGAEIESISWMTSEGFATAISAFMGQNFGAKKFDRIKDGYKKGMAIVGGIGIFASLLLLLAGGPIFSLFTPEDPKAIFEGARYLRILGFSQFFMTLEIGTGGAFNGLGRTMPPAVVGVIFNAMRIPLAYYLAKQMAMGLPGIWWAISITGIIKGIVLPGLFVKLLRKNTSFLEEE